MHEKKTVFLIVRVEQSLKKRVLEAAKRAKIKTSELIRQILNDVV